MKIRDELTQEIIARLKKIKITNPTKALQFARFVTDHHVKNSDILNHINPMDLFLAASKNEEAAKLILSSKTLQGLLEKEELYLKALKDQYRKNPEIMCLLKNEAKPVLVLSPGAIKELKKRQFKALMNQLLEQEIADIFAELGITKKVMLSRIALTETKKALTQQILELSQEKEKNEAIKDDKPGEYSSNKKAIEKNKAKLRLIEKIVNNYFDEYVVHLFLKYRKKANEDIDTLMKTLQENKIPLEAACRKFFNLKEELITVKLKKDLRAEQLQNHPDKAQEDVLFKMITPLFELMIDPISRYCLLKKLRNEIIREKAENVHTVNLQKGLAFFDKHKQDLQERLKEKTEDDLAIEAIESQQEKFQEEPEEEKEVVKGAPVTPFKTS